MTRRMRRLASRLAWSFDGFASPSYSQEGEDRVLAAMFENRETGRYVDVGAHHPRRFSNTHLLHQRGWTGLNIDPLPGVAELFHRERPRDVSLRCGVSSEAGRAVFYRFAETALSTFDQRLAEDRVQQGWQLEGKEEVELLPLAALVETHLGVGQPIDLLTVDVEGLDLDVLRSAALERIRYDVLCVEELGGHGIATGPVHALVAEHGYALQAVTGRSRIYLRT
jgi:FkbM family methyltransferase